MAAVAFGRASGGQLFKLLEGFALGGDFLAEFAAGFGFAVESLRDGGWAADFTEQQDFDLEVAAVVGDAQHVSYANFACGLGGLCVGLNAAEFTGAGCQGPRFEKAGCPQPLVDPNGGHTSILPRRSGSRHAANRLSSGTKCQPQALKRARFLQLTARLKSCPSQTLSGDG